MLRYSSTRFLSATSSSTALVDWCGRWSHILEKGWAGEQEADFVKPDYWGQFYEDAFTKSGSATFEWGAGDTRLGICRLAARLNRLLVRHGLHTLHGRHPRLLHPGCGTSGLGVALASHGWAVTNSDFSESAVGLLEELHFLGLLNQFAIGGRRKLDGGGSEFVHADVTSPPKSWQGAFSVLVEKGLLDTLLFGEDMASALERAVKYSEFVDFVLKPGGMLLQLSDAPLAMRREMLEVLLRPSCDASKSLNAWQFQLEDCDEDAKSLHWQTGAKGNLSLLVVTKPHSAADE
eukprot:TRINITY_DN79951_c0_g1_i1.p1 TRINITY_DN79951_c0_g1~~TRINITY_DN79951_c0_g1_i1.p1  ORF type:complete len:291 (+),score=50.51 TRINITY_DN79951_c0_g1_i1:49-921(+)